MYGLNKKSYRESKLSSMAFRPPVFKNEVSGNLLESLNNYEIDINKQYNFAFCGINNDIATYYLDKIDKLSYTKVHNNENYDENPGIREIY